MAVTSVVEKWVDAVAGLTRPDRTVWCDGSKAEYDGLIDLMLRDGTLLAAQPGDVSELLPAPQPSVRRGAHRAAHVHLHRAPRTTRARPTTGWRRPRRRRRPRACFAARCAAARCT